MKKTGQNTQKTCARKTYVRENYQISISLIPLYHYNLIFIIIYSTSPDKIMLKNKNFFTIQRREKLLSQSRRTTFERRIHKYTKNMK